MIRQGDQSYAMRRFTDEANRLYGVLNNRLYDRPYIAGNEYTIADMIAYPWTVNWQGQGQDIEEFKHFKRWFEEIGKRPAVERGMAVGKDLSSDTANFRRKNRRASARCFTISGPYRRRGEAHALARGPKCFPRGRGPARRW